MMTADELRTYAKENNITLPNDKGANTNWNDEVLRTAISHNHNVSINGGSEKTQYSASMSYQTNKVSYVVQISSVSAAAHFCKPKH